MYRVVLVDYEDQIIADTVMPVIPKIGELIYCYLKDGNNDYFTVTKIVYCFDEDNSFLNIDIHLE